VHLEEGSLLASGVQIPSGPHTHGTDASAPIWEQPGSRTLVRVGRGSWIGSGAVILADVGCDTIVGAGAVVTHPLPDRVVAAGVPARVMRSREARESRPA
jgi:acetyltransferase-like isoleucine patch superfamily enzyme